MMQNDSEVQPIQIAAKTNVVIGTTTKYSKRDG